MRAESTKEFLEELGRHTYRSLLSRSERAWVHRGRGTRVWKSQNPRRV